MSSVQGPTLRLSPATSLALDQLVGVGHGGDTCVDTVETRVLGYSGDTCVIQWRHLCCGVETLVLVTVETRVLVTVETCDTCHVAS